MSFNFVGEFAIILRGMKTVTLSILRLLERILPTSKKWHTAESDQELINIIEHIILILIHL